MKTKLVVISVILVSYIFAGISQGDVLYLGDGTNKPITDTGIQTWDLTTTNWLTPNDAGGTYQTWAQGSNAVFVTDGANERANISGNIEVGDITKTGAKNVELQVLSSSDSLTVNGTLPAGTYLYGTWGGSGTFGGTMILSGWIQINATPVFAPGTTIISDNAGGVTLWSPNADCTNLTIAINSRNLGLAASGVTLGSFTGNTFLDAQGGIQSVSNALFTINSLSPGSSVSSDGIGSFKVIADYTGDLTLGGGTHAFDIDFTGGATNSDMIVLNETTGDLTFGGTLDVALLGGMPVLGTTFDLFDAASFAGSFSATNLPALADERLQWSTSSLGIDGTIFVELGPAKGAVFFVQ